MQGNTISSPEEYGKAVFNVLKPNFPISTSIEGNSFDSNGGIASMPNTYATYFLQNLIGVTPFGKDGLRLEFNAVSLDRSRVQKKGRLDIVIMFSKGIPTRLGPCDFSQGSRNIVGLYRPDIMKTILPKIKNIKYNAPLN